MSEVIKCRYGAQLDDDGIVVFLIGMRINHIWRVNKWAPVFSAMARMITELMKDPSLGLRSRPRTYLSGRVVLVVQYWNSFEQLDAYARSTQGAHLPAWRAFNRRVRDNGSVGIWHETYRVGEGQAEAVYGNMPRFGLAQATTHVPVGRVGQSAARRMGVSTDDQAAVEPY